MKQVPSDKHSIAWFKLAECVARGEKERALGVYRLLSYSLEDQAFAYQLAGDLLRSFEDGTAVEQYHQAAQLYHKSKRFLEAEAVYEHLLDMVPQKELYLMHLVELYGALNDMPHAAHHVMQLFDLMIEKKKWEEIHDLVNRLDTILDVVQAARVHKKIVFAIIDEEGIPQERVLNYIKKTIDSFLLSGNDNKLQRFLSELKARNEWYYQQAYAHMQQS